MISAGTPVRWTANREPRTANLLLIAAEADAGHRHCNITDRGPRNRLNYNDERLKLLNVCCYLYRTATVTKTKLPVDRYSQGHSLGYTRWKGHVKTGQAEQLDVLCWVPEALHCYNYDLIFCWKIEVLCWSCNCYSQVRTLKSMITWLLIMVKSVSRHLYL
jgi:hypothetical protein